VVLPVFQPDLPPQRLHPLVPLDPENLAEADFPASPNSTPARAASSTRISSPTTTTPTARPADRPTVQKDADVRLLRSTLPLDNGGSIPSSQGTSSKANAYYNGWEG